MALDAAQTRGPACPRRHHVRQTFSEDPAGAAGRDTAEAPGTDLQRHGASLPRQVGQAAAVMAMNPAGNRTAERTGALRRRRRGDDGDTVGGGQNLHDGQACRDERQKAAGQSARSVLQSWWPHMEADPSSFHPAAPGRGRTRIGRSRSPECAVSSGAPSQEGRKDRSGSSPKSSPDCMP